MKFRKLQSVFIVSFLLLSIGIFSAFLIAEGDNTLTKKEIKEGWKLLFDGKSIAGWKMFKGIKGDGWEVVNGELHCKEKATQRADLLTVDQYDNFELSIDWKVAKGSNSGIIYRCTEENGATFESGPEYQLIDDVTYPDKLHDKQLSGSNYDMNAPSKKAAKPTGEYNRTRIVVKDAHVQHWLNGVKVVEYTFWTPEWQKLKEASKWKDVKPYGMSKRGYIALQDHGGGIWFKNIKIKKL